MGAVRWLGVVVLLAACAAQAATPAATASFRVSLQVFAACVVSHEEGPVRARGPGVNCSFKAPHALQVRLEDDPDPQAGKGARAMVTTLVF